ncbi:MAG TPA: hypothetical protein VE862_08140 [Candidatus Acidoferrum sp.]|nr:hypothetical protein [Candidatus Acidoferrum sp.]
MHIGLLISIPLAITYTLLAASMPRSGGDYVWISRTIKNELFRAIASS